MVLLGGLRAIMTKQEFRRTQFAGCDGMPYSIIGFYALRIKISIKKCRFPMIFFAFFGLTISLYFCLTGLALITTFNTSFITFCLLITFLSNFIFISLMVFFYLFRKANFAITLMPIKVSFVFVKFGKRFNFLASGAAFCLNCISHCFSPVQKSSRLEPVAGYAPVVGSLYYIL